MLHKYYLYKEYTPFFFIISIIDWFRKFLRLYMGYVPRSRYKGWPKEELKKQCATHSEYQKKILYTKKPKSYCVDMLMFFQSFFFLSYFSSSVKLQAHKIYWLFNLNHCYLKYLKASIVLETENIWKYVALLVADLQWSLEYFPVHLAKRTSNTQRQIYTQIHAQKNNKLLKILITLNFAFPLDDFNEILKSV